MKNKEDSSIPLQPGNGGEEKVKCFADKTTSDSTFIRMVDNDNEYKAEVFDNVVAFHIYKDGKKDFSTSIELPSPPSPDVAEMAKEYCATQWIDHAYLFKGEPPVHVKQTIKDFEAGYTASLSSRQVGEAVDQEEL